MRNRQSRGFTLVELLVVIGIIALLISILLPTLNKARQVARSVVCLSSLRQLAMSTLSYTADCKGKLPFNFVQLEPGGVAGPVAMQNNVITGLYVDGYLTKGPKVFVHRGLSAGVEPSGPIYGPPISICPDSAQSDWFTEQGTTTGFTTGRWRNSGSTSYLILSYAGGDDNAAVYSYQNKGGQIFTTYSFNAMSERAEQQWFAPIQYWVGGVSHKYESPFANHCELQVTAANYLPHPQMSISSIRKSEDTWMCYDGCGESPGISGSSYFTPQISIYGVVFRHANLSANFAYFDGHAENLSSTEIDGGPLYSGSKGASPTSAGNGIGMIADARVLLDH